jgi:large subunit ribosomal protein L32
MGLPAKRRTKSSKRRRASHFALKHNPLSACSHCKQPVLPHRACPHCGYYRGRSVIVIKSLLDKKTKKRARKEKATKESDKKEDSAKSDKK